MNDTVMKFEEKTIFKLRALYQRYGYLPYKMSKFEEYELYAGNKDFLVSDRVITFNDTNGKLMALKPDVTLSIIRNGEDIPGVKQKVCYNENVYRVSENTNRFKEILQTGLECIGDIDLYDICEVILLSAESLAAISENFCIEISNLDLVYSIVSGVCPKLDFIREVNPCIAQKNTHDLKKVCESYGVSEEGYRKIARIASLSGEMKQVLHELEDLCPPESLASMKQLSSLIGASKYAGSIRFDFSLLNDINYYNGFIFRGYVDGIYCSVLAGGQYGKMMQKMNRSAQAVGFALYLDKVAELDGERKSLDVDDLLLYNERTPMKEVAAWVNDLVSHGHSVSAQKAIPPKLRYGKLWDISR